MWHYTIIIGINVLPHTTKHDEITTWHKYFIIVVIIMNICNRYLTSPIRKSYDWRFLLLKYKCSKNIFLYKIINHNILLENFFFHWSYSKYTKLTILLINIWWSSLLGFLMCIKIQMCNYYKENINMKLTLRLCLYYLAEFRSTLPGTV